MENFLSLSEILFPNQYRRKVLALMLMNPQKWLHLRELARLTGASPGTLKKELDGLVAVGLLKLQKVGNQTQFCANTEHPVYPELSGLIRKTTGLKDVLVTALQALAPQTHVCLALDLSLPTEEIRSMAISGWKKVFSSEAACAALQNRPCVFLLLAH
jgi:hypothetical protein